MTKKEFKEGFFTKDRPVAGTEYVNVELLKEWFARTCEQVGESVDDWGVFDDKFYKMLEEMPKADVQPVVHCKDCWKRGTEHCSVNMPYKDKLIIAKVADNFFCKGGDEHD